MKSHGWKISTTEYVEEEEWDRSLNDSDDDDIDIDNDDNFWRRAGG